MEVAASARSEITIVEVCPPTVTTTWIGSPPSGTAEATKVRVLASKRIHAGNGPPLWVVTSTGAVLPAVSCIWAGSGKEKPVPEVAVSLGTETVTIPESLAEGGRTRETEMPAPAPPAAALSLFDDPLPVVPPATAFTPDVVDSPDVAVEVPPELLVEPLDELEPLPDVVAVPLDEKTPPEELD